MAKESSFRLCIAFLLIVQIACWALTLLDLMHPGRPQMLLRTTMDTMSMHFAHLAGQRNLVGYRDVVGLFVG
jgi:hypothetical protein